MKHLSISILFTSSMLMLTSSSFAGSPACLDHGQALAVDDAQVMNWKSTTPNQTLKRAHVEGQLSRLYSDHSGHNHFEIQVGPTPADTLEVVYNASFGTLPQLHVGMRVEACGDYITSNEPGPRYPASPDGAIIHWVHQNPSGQGHDSGYLILDGTLYGNSGSGTGGG